MLRKNMAPGKTHVNSKLKNKFQAKNKSSSGVKKAKKNSLPKKQVKSIFLKGIVKSLHEDTEKYISPKLYQMKTGSWLVKSDLDQNKPINLWRKALKDDYTL